MGSADGKEKLEGLAPLCACRWHCKRIKCQLQLSGIFPDDMPGQQSQMPAVTLGYCRTFLDPVRKIVVSPAAAGALLLYNPWLLLHDDRARGKTCWLRSEQPALMPNGSAIRV